VAAADETDPARARRARHVHGLHRAPIADGAIDAQEYGAFGSAVGAIAATPAVIGAR